MMRLMSAYLRPYWASVALVLVLTFAQTMSSLYLPNQMSDIVDTGIIRGDSGYILRVGVAMLAVALLGGLASVLASYFGARATAGFGQRLRMDLFTHVTGYSLREYDHWGGSTLIVRTTNDVTQVQQLVYMVLRMLVMAPLTALGGIILAVRTDAPLSVVLLVVIPLMALSIYLVMGRGFGLFAALQKKIDRISLVLRENLSGVRVVRSFGRTPYEIDRFDAANSDLTDTSVRVFQLMATMMPLVMLIMNLSTVAIVWFGARQINSEALQIGQLMAFIQYVTQIMGSVMMVSMMLFMLPRGQASSQRIGEVMDMAPAVTDPAAPASAPHGVHARLEFQNVTFRYPGAEEPALSGISFSAGPGEVTAVIGGTGSGKSTLLNLIPRFYDIEGGRILVDGVDIRDLSQEELRAKIGYVPQRALLFTGTVLENIRYGAPEASEADVRRAAEVAQAAEFIDELDGGLQAGVAQGGVNLSGGQRQRLAMARALVRPAEIYLFDDSFSALDYRTDARLRAAMRPVVAQATTLIVAQRVSTVKDADRILVLDEGRLVGCGTHAALLQGCPVYQEIVASQLTPEEVA